MNPSSIPTATYRLQFNRDFTFTDAIKIIPYLHRLGISHVYASPFLKARSGSLHGYNIVDHNALNPEIGDQNSFAAYVDTLHQYGMGQILDIVPNHMGVGGDDNVWWLDVLENGESSTYATYFDIDWHPVNPALHNKILLPFLADHYGTVLERGEIKLHFDSDNGTFSIRYFEHLFPIDPRTYSQILVFRLDTLVQNFDNDHQIIRDFTALITDCKSLPRRTDLSAKHRQQRQRKIAACKIHLAELCLSRPEIRKFIDQNVTCFNGIAGQPESYNMLHYLLETQAYRLAYWKVASEEINYRRFFDINELAAIRMENKETFDAAHQLLRQMIKKGQVNGLRIDHPDGLSDPYTYYHNLQKLISEALGNGKHKTEQSFYLWVEKILAYFERLPSDWPVSGTTGYDATFLLNGIFVYHDAESQFNRLYSRFIGQNLNFEELLYDRKKLITRRMLSSELTVLANLLGGIAQTNRYTCDFTYQGLRDALSEVVACFPVYRTYITVERINDEDQHYVQWAIALAKRRSPAADILIFDFIYELLVLAHLDEYSAAVRRRAIQFALRFQQYTAPVTAKSMEDTAFYIYNRLVSLNDVGFNTCAFGVSLNSFHQANKQRLLDWPHAMVTTSTHDSKRSEDVRARISVLSEVADEWRRHLGRWSRLNRSKKRLVNDERAPSRNDEYLIYQTLIGVWPLASLDAAALEAPGTLRVRIENYMLKAIKEAKVHTSWINPNEEYEEAIRYFVRALLSDSKRNAFLADFLPFQKRVARFGLFNGLSQTLLKLTVPGVPDIYQGNELWTFNLVDPDNRGPVDYSLRQTALQALIKESETSKNLAKFTRQLLEQIDKDRAKLFVTWKTLILRRQYPHLFNDGKYIGLATQGCKADHICAFARRLNGKEVIVVAPRHFVRLIADENNFPLGPVWKDTLIEAPRCQQVKTYRNVLTNEYVTSMAINDQLFFRAADLLQNFSVALLISE
jgi:malto-oligosyltrehalose synthase